MDKVEKLYGIDATDGYLFATYEEAEGHAKRRAQSNEQDYYVTKAVARVKYPLPQYEVEKIG